MAARPRATVVPQWTTSCASAALPRLRPAAPTASAPGAIPRSARTRRARALPRPAAVRRHAVARLEEHDVPAYHLGWTGPRAARRSDDGGACTRRSRGRPVPRPPPPLLDGPRSAFKTTIAPITSASTARPRGRHSSRPGEQQGHRVGELASRTASGPGGAPLRQESWDRPPRAGARASSRRFRARMSVPRRRQTSSPVRACAGSLGAKVVADRTSAPFRMGRESHGGRGCGGLRFDHSPSSSEPASPVALGSNSTERGTTITGQAAERVSGVETLPTSTRWSGP